MGLPLDAGHLVQEDWPGKRECLVQHSDFQNHLSGSELREAMQPYHDTN